MPRHRARDGKPLVRSLLQTRAPKVGAPNVWCIAWRGYTRFFLVQENALSKKSFDTHVHEIDVRGADSMRAAPSLS